MKTIKEIWLAVAIVLLATFSEENLAWDLAILAHFLLAGLCQPKETYTDK